MIKKTLLIFCLIPILIKVNGQSKFEDLPWIGFKWISGVVSNHHFDKLAITIPLKIDNLPQEFEAQFDLGANLTMLYENPMKPYFEKYNHLKDKKAMEDGFQWIKNLKITLGGIVFDNRRVFLKINYGEALTADSIKNSKVRKIGTIGADFVQDKILILDYKHDRLCMLNTLDPTIEKNVSFIPYKDDGQGRVILPFIINGNNYEVLFDTGASIFGFASTKKNWRTICDTTVVTKLDSIRSWGEYLDFWESPIKYDLIIKGTDIKIENAKMSFPNPTPEKFETFLTNSGISGITGNIFFLKKCVFIDFKNKRFGILKCDPK